EDFISHEVSHVCWWGGTGVMGRTSQPDMRFLNEATAEFSSLLFCEQVLSEEKGFEEWKLRMEWYRETKDYYKSRGWTEPPIINPASAGSFSITYYKGACVFWALRYYMGEENFRNAMIEIFDNYARSNAPSDDEWYRPSIADFYNTFKKHAKRDISGFWSTYVGSTELPRLEYSINRIRYKGVIYDSVNLKNPTKHESPLMVHVYHSDGTYEEVILEELDQSFRIDGHASGVFFHDYMGSMPEPDDISNKMNTASIAAVISWKPPTIYVSEKDGEECVSRAERWVEKTGGELVIDDFSELPFKKPILLVGPSAILEFASDEYKNLRIKDTEDGLNWLGKEFEGDFGAIVVTYDKDDVERPIIIDTGVGEIPENLSYTGLYTTSDSRIIMGFNYLNAETEEIPGPDALCQLPWENIDSQVDKSAFYVSFTNPRPFKISYNGFSFEDFEFMDIEKEFEPETLSSEVLLDLSGGKTQNVKISHSDRFVTEEWDFNISLDPDIDEFNGPKKIIIPETVKGKSIEIKWIEQMEYIYAIDDVKMTDWKMGSRLALTDLKKGRHTLKMLFNDNGLLSPIIEKEFVSGVSEPELQLDKTFALWKNGKIRITGKTTPGVELIPTGEVDEEGNFEIIFATDEVPQVLSVTAKNEYGLETTKSISIIKFIKLDMFLGKENVTSDTGETWTLDVPPQLVNGSTYVPMRFIGERLGAEVSWVADEKKVIYSLGNTRIEIWIGNDISKVNGIDTKMPGEPVIISGRTLVPVRFVSEALGAKVSWYGEEKKITIEYPNME
ncbi:MAG: stalk domain-containing protein, partial [Caldisericia bacterium]